MFDTILKTFGARVDHIQIELFMEETEKFSTKINQIIENTLIEEEGYNVGQ